MDLIAILLWFLGIYLFIGVIIFYAMVNNIFIFRSSSFELNFPDAEIEHYQLDDPRIAYYLVKQSNQLSVRWAVLFHSWGRNAKRMESRARIYIDQGYSVLLVDAPGHGNSQWVPVIMGTDYAKYAQQICELHGIEKPVVHGLSFGAISALLFAMQNEVEAIVAEALIANFEDMYDGFFQSLHLPKSLYGWIPWLILKLGPDWERLAPVNILPKLSDPIFLIHGKNDTMFVPELHFEINLELLKDRDNVFSWLVPDSPHSRMACHPSYRDRLEEFMNYIENK